MNIKGKHLKLVRYIRDNRGVKIEVAVKAGFEASMIASLWYNKQIIAVTDGKIYLPKETAERANVYIHCYKRNHGE